MKSAWTPWWPPALATALLVAVLLLGASAPAHANPKYAAIVMDEASGEVLYSRKADLNRFPASLTKVMTLYVLFDEITAGRLKLSDKMKASKRAAGQPPSKLGIRAGQKIVVEDAIRSLVIRSANDVAVVVAEHISGTERQFARRMTQQARKLGMTKTRFRNASGLPNRSQTTTARDMAILGQRMRKDFPQFGDYFTETSFRWGGRKWTTHNNILLHYDGADGMKTGYTRASGFNLITSAERHGTRLIAVVMGGRTANRRDREMRRILDLNYKRIANNPKYRQRLLAALPKPVPRPGTRPAADRPVQIASALPVPSPVTPPPDTAADDVPVPVVVARADAVGSDAPTTALPVPKAPDTAASPRQDAPTEDSLDRLDDDPIAMQIARASDVEVPLSEKPAPNLRGMPPRESPRASEETAVAALGAEGAARRSLGSGRRLSLTLEADALADGALADGEGIGEGDGRPAGDYSLLAELPRTGVGIQIGAFLRITTAMKYIDNAMALVPDVLTGGKAAIVQSKTESGDIYRARFGPFDEDEANTACGLLEARGMECFSIEDNNWGEVIRPK